MPEKHAILSASGANKWLNCQASARLEELITNVYGESSTEYTVEGTKAHSFAERSFNEDIETLEFPNEQMKDCVKEYHDYVIKLYEEALSVDKYALKFHEVELNYSNYIKDGFGTGDTIITSNDKLIIVDFKYGQGIAVSAINNPQMKLYGLGAINEYGYFNNFTNIEMHIFQPRKDNISVFSMKSEDLLKWGESIKEIGFIAFTGEAKCNPGEHCQFCKARAICRARATLLEKLDTDNDNFKLMTVEELSNIYDKAIVCESYIKQLKADILARMMYGEKIPGLKLKAPRATRCYSDQTAVEEKLKQMGYDDALIHKPRELITLTDLKTLIKTKGIKELEDNGFIIKTEGTTPSIVKADDPCEEWLPKEILKNEFDAIE